jgi:transcriptional/translational regulatory protein YebC/TACO1
MGGRSHGSVAMMLYKITLVMDDEDDYDGMMENLIALGANDITEEEIEEANKEYKSGPRKPKKD